MRIKTIRLYNLRVVEQLAFLKHILPILMQHHANNAKLKRLVEGLSKSTVELSIAQNRGSFKGETESVKQANKSRTESLKMFCKFVEAFSHSDNPTIKESATLLLAAIKKERANFTSSNQNGQTGSIDGLNSLFTTNPRYTDALSALGGKPFWDKVMLADENYNGRYSNRTELKAGAEADESATEITKKTYTQCKDIFEMVESLYNVEEKAEYLDVINKINVEIEAIMAIVHKRESNAEKESEENQEEKKKKKEEKRLMQEEKKMKQEAKKMQENDKSEDVIDSIKSK